MVKLIDYANKIDDLLNHKNPFAIITAAHLKTKATKDNPQERYTWKWTITRALDTKFSSNVPADIRQVIKDLNNRLMLKKLLRSTSCIQPTGNQIRSRPPWG